MPEGAGMPKLDATEMEPKVWQFLTTKLGETGHNMTKARNYIYHI